MRTNAGRDWMSRIMGDPSSSGAGNYAPANWIALTADATAPNAANTTLTSEITGGTMGRAQCAYAHTDGQASYTLSRSFTSDRTVTVQKFGLFTASSGGTMAFETLLDSPASLQSGDTLSIVETVSL